MVATKLGKKVQLFKDLLEGVSTTGHEATQ